MVSSHLLHAALQVQKVPSRRAMLRVRVSGRHGHELDRARSNNRCWFIQDSGAGNNLVAGFNGATYGAVNLLQ